MCLVLVINQHLIHRISTLAGTRRDMDLHSVWIIIVILFKYWNGMFCIPLINNCDYTTKFDSEKAETKKN